MLLPAQALRDTAELMPSNTGSRVPAFAEPSDFMPLLGKKGNKREKEFNGCHLEFGAHAPNGSRRICISW